MQDRKNLLLKFAVPQALHRGGTPNLLSIFFNHMEQVQQSPNTRAGQPVHQQAYGPQQGAILARCHCDLGGVTKVAVPSSHGSFKNFVPFRCQIMGSPTSGVPDKDTDVGRRLRKQLGDI